MNLKNISCGIKQYNRHYLIKFVMSTETVLIKQTSNNNEGTNNNYLSNMFLKRSQQIVRVFTMWTGVNIVFVQFLKKILKQALIPVAVLEFYQYVTSALSLYSAICLQKKSHMILIKKLVRMSKGYSMYPVYLFPLCLKVLHNISNSI